MAPPHWQTVDVVSDVHLQLSEPVTAADWTRYIDNLNSDALFVLGDLLELWVGDDTLVDPAVQSTAEGAFLQSVCDTLARCAAKRPVYVMHGNRDFLLGPGFHRRTGTQALPDPCVLVWGDRRWLFTHGDAWCLADHAYMAFRSQVRTPAWTARFLQQPLTDRLTWARQARAHSEATKQSGTQVYADVDTPTAVAQLVEQAASTLVHGHTHQPADHPLGAGLRRLVLPDWDTMASPKRGGGLRLHRDGRWERTPPP